MKTNTKQYEKLKFEISDIVVNLIQYKEKNIIHKNTSVQIDNFVISHSSKYIKDNTIFLIRQDYDHVQKAILF